MVGTQEVINPSASHPTQEFLDANQYSRKSILRYERIFGHNWVSTGGEKTTKEFCERLNLKAGQKVLDVGCGTGGSAFYMAEKYGVSVLGVDLASHMIGLANERLQTMSKTIKNNVKFEIADITKVEYDADSFDVVYSRDTVLHIPDKELLYSQLKKYLKPGGTLFVTDYCRGDQEHSQQFLDYVRRRGYDLRTVAGYGKVLESCGYSNVQATDMTETFMKVLSEELARFEPTKDEFIKEFSKEDYSEIVEGWRAKQLRCKAGDQAWGLFIARK